MTDDYEEASAKVQCMCNALHKLCDEDRDMILKLFFEVRQILKGKDCHIGIGLAVQLMLNGCYQMAVAYVDDKDDLHQEFNYFVSGACMMTHYTALAAERDTAAEGGIH